MYLIIADSVAGGFGQHNKKSFVHYSLESLDLDYIDHSANGMTTTQYLQYLSDGKKVCKEQGDLIKDEAITNIIYALGNVDCRVKFKSNNCLSFLIPRRYRKEKFDPRPYYSKRKIKKVFQHIDNLFRSFFRNFSVKTGNISLYVDFDTYIDNTHRILGTYPHAKIVLISTSTVNNKNFPHAEKMFKEADRKLLEISSTHHANFFDLKENLNSSLLMLDGFHLTQKGHLSVATKFSKFLNNNKC